jgi:threonine/homoserine/homoserine lactone efflux protein
VRGPVVWGLDTATSAGEAPYLYPLALFLSQVVVVSLSGVMAPGPVTAATLAAGTRARHAGGLIALGHGVVEFPLMLVLTAGMSTLFQSHGVKIAIGLIGGAFLLHMGGRMLLGLGRADETVAKFTAANPIWIGIALTAGNPYFLLWWMAVGLNLAGRAIEFGALAFGLFAIVHWLCDLLWLEALSVASFKGTRLLGGRSQRIVLAICAVALIVVGVMFLYDAGGDLFRRVPTPI